MKVNRTIIYSIITVLSCVMNVELKAANRPNILFLFGDDHAYESIGLMSDGYVQTPTIDKLAAEGVYFERAYNMGAWGGAVCVASRAMLNTGKSLWNSHRWSMSKKDKGKSSHDSNAHPLFWSQRMQKAGLFRGEVACLWL